MIASFVDAYWRPSPNFGQRRDSARPELVVLHYTAMASAGDALARLCAPEFEVSTHYLIAANGELYQLVAESERAWHAGRGEWRGRADINSRSIGIELDNPGDRPFADPQMAVLERLLGQILNRWNIPVEGVIGHSDFAFGRKSDPGPRFDWRRLAKSGLAVWPQSSDRLHPPDPAVFAAAVRSFGFPGAPVAGTRSDSCHLLAAFRMRFAPWRSGPLAGDDMAAAMDLAARFGTSELDLAAGGA